MSQNYFHGVEVIEMTGTPAISSVSASVIGLIGVLKFEPQTTKQEIENQATAETNKTEDLAEKEKIEAKKTADLTALKVREEFIAIAYDKPYLVTSLDDFFNYFGEKCTGTLVDALQDIYSQTPAKVVIAPIKENTQIDIGIKLLEKAPETLKVYPKILTAPGLIQSEKEEKLTTEGKLQHSTSNNNTEAKKGKVLSDNALFAEKLVELAEKLKAIALVDLHALDNTLTLIKEATGKLKESDRLYLLYPNLIVKRKNVAGMEIDTIRPASAFVASLIVKSDTERGFWFSPSNYKLSGIVGLSQEIAFTLGDSHCFANQLNEENITTIIWQDGHRLWGNKSYIKEGPSKNFEFLSVRRTADVLNMSLLKNHFWAIDQAITQNLKDTIVDSVNTYMRTLKMQGAIINGKCWADDKKNTVDSLANGQFYFNFDFTAPYPAERITFQSYLTKEYLNEVLA